MENNWMHTFSKCISAIWKVNILVQDLNSGLRDNYTSSTCIVGVDYVSFHLKEEKKKKKKTFLSKF